MSDASGGVAGAEALGVALAAMGLEGRVEVRGRLALFVPREAGAIAVFGTPALRDASVRAARGLGFTHLALELG